MSITFKNVFNELVTENQAQQLDTYYKVFEEDGSVKIVEEFYKGEFSNLSYYKGAGETHTQIMSAIFTPGKHIRIIEKSVVGGTYTLEKSFVYNGLGLLTTKANELFDINKDLVGHEWIEDLTTGIPVYESTKKYFYDRSVNPDTYLFESFFTSNGELDHIYYNNLHLNSDEQDSIALFNTPEDIQTLRDLAGISQDVADYYVSANVIPNF